MAHGLRHTDCDCCEVALKVVVSLLSLLEQAHPYVQSMNVAEHMMDGFGLRSNQRSDGLLAQIDDALREPSP